MDGIRGLPYGLSMEKFLEVLETGRNRYSHMGHRVQFNRIRLDLMRAAKMSEGTYQAMRKRGLI